MKIYQDIFKALKNHNENECLNLLDTLIKETNNINVNLKNQNNIYLIQMGLPYIKVVKKLLSMGAWIDVLDSDHRTLLYPLLKSNDINTFKLILENSINTIGQPLYDIVDKMNKNIIHQAIEIGSIQIVKVLIEYHEIKYDEYLHYIVINKRIDILLHLIKQNMIKNISITDTNQDTILHIATHYKNKEMIKLLLDTNINVDIVNKNYYLPIHDTINNNDFDSFCKILEKTKYINQTDNNGQTLLHLCVKKPEFIEKILNKKSFDTLIQDHNGNTPLHIAIKNKYKKSIELLLGITNPNIQDNQGSTILHYLLLEKSLVKLFLDEIDKTSYKYLVNVMITNHNSELSTKVLNNLPETILNKFYNSMYHNYISFSKLRSKMTLSEYKSKLKNLSLSYPKPVNLDPKYFKKPNKSVMNLPSGLPIDILINTLYVVKKHRNLHTIINKNDLINNPSLEHRYQSLGFHSNHNDLLNHMVHWFYQDLYFPTWFDQELKLIASTKGIEYLFIFLGITTNKGFHLNMLIIKDQKVYRFEPYGQVGSVNFFYNSYQLDGELKIYFKKLNYHYCSPRDYQNPIGFQNLETKEKQNRRIIDPCGFCVSWCFWFIELLGKHYTHTPRLLIQKIHQYITFHDLSYKEIIQAYSQTLTTHRDQMMKIRNLHIDDWINDKVDEKLLIKFIKSI